MGQIAIQVDSRAEVEAFSLSDAEWDEVLALPSGSLVMPGTEWPAIPKTSIRGLRFFAHKSGFPGEKPKPKSYAHTRLQIDIVKTARNLGYAANIEVRGPDKTNPKWIADTLLTSIAGKKVALEVQLTSQHLDEFLSRTDRYSKSDIQTCWILSPQAMKRLGNALFYDNIAYNQGIGEEAGKYASDDERVRFFWVNVSNKDYYPDSLLEIKFGRGENMVRLSLEDAIHGIMKDCPQWCFPYWKWVVAERN